MEAQHPASLSSLPIEMLRKVCDYLDNCDIKSVRLTCSYLAASELKFNRVFLSPDPRNVEVFLAVADHAIYCRRVTEIIVDDALLAPAGCVSDEGNTLLCLEPQYPATLFHEQDEDDWFDKRCRKQIEEVVDVIYSGRSDLYLPRLRPFNPKETRRIYSRLLQQQRRALDSRKYDSILETGLNKFTALRRVIVTVATHGLAFNPTYQTPMLRQLPRNMNYPRPRGWLSYKINSVGDDLVGEMKGHVYYGLRTLVRALANNKDGGRVTELVVEAQHLSGLGTFHFVDGPSFLPMELMANIEAVLARPTMRHVHLDLETEWKEWAGQADLAVEERSEAIRRVLEGAAGGQGLESIVIRGAACGMEITSLQQTLTSQAMARVRHLGLVNFLAQGDDLINFLASLPPTLRTLDLSRLTLKGHNFDMYSFIMRMRDELGWAAREYRPRVSFGQIFSKGQDLTRCFLCVDEEMNAFLYEGARYPLEERMGSQVWTPPGFGIEKSLYGELYLPLDEEQNNSESES